MYIYTIIVKMFFLSYLIPYHTYISSDDCISNLNVVFVIDWELLNTQCIIPIRLFLNTVIIRSQT